MKNYYASFTNMTFVEKISEENDTVFFNVINENNEEPSCVSKLDSAMFNILYPTATNEDGLRRWKSLKKLEVMI